MSRRLVSMRVAISTDLKSELRALENQWRAILFAISFRRYMRAVPVDPYAEWRGRRP